MRYLLTLVVVLAIGHLPANAADAQPRCPKEFISNISPEILASCRGAADQGDVNAQVVLGDFYTRAVGIPRDRNQALGWYQRAAEAGHAGAQYKLGLELDKGSPDEKKSGKEWFIKAAMQGHEPSLSLLRFQMYERSKKDPTFDEYLEILKKAAMVDMPDKRVLAVTRAQVCQAFREGAGTPIDYKSAAHWCAKAAESGSAHAEWELIKMYKLGLGVAQDHKKAEDMWRSFFTRQVAVTPENNHLLWYTNAARTGFCSAAEVIGESHETGKLGAAQSAERSKAWGNYARRCRALEKAG